MNLSPKILIEEFDGNQNLKIKNRYNTFYAGFFTKGECNVPTFCYSLLDFKTKFGKPNSKNIIDWLQIYNYFQYNNSSIIISRVIGENSSNSVAALPNPSNPVKILNFDDFLRQQDTLISDSDCIKVIAKTPGEWGNDINVAIFTKNELEKNLNIFDYHKAKNLTGAMYDGEYCICVFYKRQLVERFLVNFNEIDRINEESRYVYILNNFLNYKLYDGNIFWIDGDEEIADGNLELNRRPIFIGTSVLSLKNGFSDEPSFSQIGEEYETFEMDIDLDFILSNSKNVNSALKLANLRKDCIALVDVPKEKPKEFIKSLISCERFLAYRNNKKQINPFNEKEIWVPVLGDVLGLRTQLLESDIKNSHCKVQYSILNCLAIDKIYNEYERDDLYLNKINVIQKFNNYYYFNSEKCSNNHNLTNVLILIKLSRLSNKVLNYYIFEFNDEFNRNAVKKHISAICDDMRANREIQDFNVVCDETNNTRFDHEIKVDVYYKPQYMVEFVKLRFYTNLN